MFARGLRVRARPRAVGGGYPLPRIRLASPHLSPSARREKNPPNQRRVARCVRACFFVGMSSLWLLDHADREDIHKTTVFSAVEEGCVFLWVCFCIGGFDDDDVFRQDCLVVCVWGFGLPPLSPPTVGSCQGVASLGWVDYLAVRSRHRVLICVEGVCTRCGGPSDGRVLRG